MGKLGPGWLPPRVPANPPDWSRQKDKMCGRCGKRPVSERIHFCPECERHWSQVYQSGGFWDQRRGYQARRINETKLYTMLLIKARAKLERAEKALEASILAGEPEYLRRCRWDDHGQTWADLERLRDEIREHRRELIRGRSGIRPLP